MCGFRFISKFFPAFVFLKDGQHGLVVAGPDIENFRSGANKQFLNKDMATDVISFDLSDEFEPGRNFQIVVNLEQACRQGKKRGHSAESELALYITHGLLHQLGYDDLEPQQAGQMHEKEDAILQSNGFGVIYHKQEKE